MLTPAITLGGADRGRRSHRPARQLAAPTLVRDHGGGLLRYPGAQLRPGAVSGGGAGTAAWRVLGCVRPPVATVLARYRRSGAAALRSVAYRRPLANGGPGQDAEPAFRAWLRRLAGPAMARASRGIANRYQGAGLGHPDLDSGCRTTLGIDDLPSRPLRRQHRAVAGDVADLCRAAAHDSAGAGTRVCHAASTVPTSPTGAGQVLGSAAPVWSVPRFGEMRDGGATPDQRLSALVMDDGSR